MGQYYRPVILLPAGVIIAYWDCDHYNNGAKLMEHSYIGNEVVDQVMGYLDSNPSRLIWAGDYADRLCPGGPTLYDLADDLPAMQTSHGHNSSLRYVINHSREQYLYLDEYRLGDFTIHPLPLLTAVGNGRGGGDYCGINLDSVGTWAGDLISTSANPAAVSGYRSYNISFREDSTYARAC